MKPFIKIFLIVIFSFSTHLNQVYAMGAWRPRIPSTPPGRTIPPVPPIPNPEKPTGSNFKEKILDLAQSSNCSDFHFSGRGLAPLGYIKGMAITYARSYCRIKNKSTKSTIFARVMNQAASSRSSADALNYYQSKFSGVAKSLNVSQEEPLRLVYLLGIGLGMRESSGSYCEGWDRSAGANRSASQAEAGVFQTSYDSIGSSPSLMNLYSEYKNANSKRCFKDVFIEGVSCKKRNLLGSGEGVNFQALSLDCPAFATEYAMTMLRVNRSHYGPINRKEAQIVPACLDLLKEVEDLIQTDLQSACAELI